MNCNVGFIQYKIQPLVKGLFIAVSLLLLLLFQNCGPSKATGDFTVPSHQDLDQNATYFGSTKISITAVRGLTTGENYPSAGIAWGDSYHLSGLLMKYEREQDPAVMLEFFARVNSIIAKRDDKANRYSRAATWSYRLSRIAATKRGGAPFVNQCVT